MKSNKFIVLFDGDCMFCNNTVLFIIKHDKKDNFRFASQQSEIGYQILNNNGFNNKSLETIILLKEEKIYFKTDALIEICKGLSGMPRLCIPLKIIPSRVRNFFYDIFSKYRYKLFGKKNNCEIPPPEIRSKFLS